MGFILFFPICLLKNIIFKAEITNFQKKGRKGGRKKGRKEEREGEREEEPIVLNSIIHRLGKKKSIRDKKIKEKSTYLALYLSLCIRSEKS